MDSRTDDSRISRRRVLVGAAGAAAAVGTAGTALAQEDNESEDGGGGDESGGDGGGNESGDGGGGNETDGGGNESEGGGGGGGGGTEEVIVGPGGDLVFEPDELTIQPGTTVVWTWDSDNHNVNPSEQPEEAEWEGHQELENAGFEYEHTFDVEGEYHYVCDPHVGQGMEGDVIVDPEAGGAGGGGEAEVEVHDLGVPIQAHYVGIATILAIFVSLVFTFYTLKYAESSHSSSPGRR